MEPHEKVYKTRKRIFIDNFIGGIAWALGATVGIAIIGFLISKIDLVPLVGNFVADVNEYILQNNPRMLK